MELSTLQQITNIDGFKFPSFPPDKLTDVLAIGKPKFCSSFLPLLRLKQGLGGVGGGGGAGLWTFYIRHKFCCWLEICRSLFEEVSIDSPHVFDLCYCPSPLSDYG